MKLIKKINFCNPAYILVSLSIIMCLILIKFNISYGKDYDPINIEVYQGCIKQIPPSGIVYMTDLGLCTYTSQVYFSFALLDNGTFRYRAKDSQVIEASGIAMPSYAYPDLEGEYVINGTKINGYIDGEQVFRLTKLGPNFQLLANDFWRSSFHKYNYHIALEFKLLFAFSFVYYPDCFLQVTIEPAGARDAGARWRVTSGPDTEWKTSGTILNLPGGSYTVEFNTVTGLSTPANASVTVTAIKDKVTKITGTYTLEAPDTGSLQVTIEPVGARDAGARWRVTSGPDTGWKTSGTTLNLLVGSYTVEFNTVTGWSAPSNNGVTVSKNTTSNITGTYTQSTTLQTGILGVIMLLLNDE